MRDWLQPHRVVLIGLAVALVLACAWFLRWDWLAEPKYQLLIVLGIWRTLWILVVTMVIGMLLAVPLGLAQAAGPWYLAAPARAFCSVIRGTPLLLQLWLLYYGLGSLFPQFPWIRQSDLWPILRQAWPYAVLALTLTSSTSSCCATSATCALIRVASASLASACAANCAPIASPASRARPPCPPPSPPWNSA